MSATLSTWPETTAASSPAADGQHGGNEPDHRRDSQELLPRPPPIPCMASRSAGGTLSRSPASSGAY